VIDPSTQTTSLRIGVAIDIAVDDDMPGTGLGFIETDLKKRIRFLPRSQGLAHYYSRLRHADVLLVTGPVTRNMREALERTYNATPDPKWVVAVGDCAANGGVFAGSYAVVGGVKDVIPVDLHIRGCPPRPVQLLQGLLALMEKPTA